MTRETTTRDWRTICDSEWAALRDDLEFMELCHALLEGWMRACQAGSHASAWDFSPWGTPWPPAPAPGSGRDGADADSAARPAGADAAAGPSAAAAASRPRDGLGAWAGDEFSPAHADGLADGMADGLADLA